MRLNETLSYFFYWVIFLGQRIRNTVRVRSFPSFRWRRCDRLLLRMWWHLLHSSNYKAVFSLFYSFLVMCSCFRKSSTKDLAERNRKTSSRNWRFPTWLAWWGRKRKSTEWPGLIKLGNHAAPNPQCVALFLLVFYFVFSILHSYLVVFNPLWKLKE